MAEKISQIPPFGLRAPQELMEWVKRKAAEQERSMNFVLNQILRDAKAADEVEEAA